jgi:hypothetical protein|tara:strand:- start:600 stop:1163 length:564 start_codon:yes stop_codon:yes gene_type:complete
MEFRNNNKSSRVSRAKRLHSKFHNKLYYYFAVCLLSISPVLAEGDTNNSSNPVAAATGNVTNQAVQFQNNGAPSRQSFGNNISCNGSTMTFSPFYMGNDTEPQTEDGYVISENWGFQINFSVPLNRDLTKQCERMAESQIQKNKLDFELVRALKCTEIQRKGFTFRPGTRVAHLCSDVVPIQSLLNK